MCMYPLAERLKPTSHSDYDVFFYLPQWTAVFTLLDVRMGQLEPCQLPPVGPRARDGRANPRRRLPHGQGHRHAHAQSPEQQHQETQYVLAFTQF